MRPETRRTHWEKKKKKKMAIVLHYWDIRGLAQVPRLLLALAGVEYEDRLYSDNEVWAKAKSEMKSAFPNIPALEHPELPFTLTESKAVIQFIARRYKLYGDTAVEAAVVDNLIFRAEDVRASFTGLVYGSKNFAEDRVAFEAALPGRLAPFERFLAGRSTRHAASNSVTSADIFLYELFLVLSRFCPAVFAALPQCLALRDTVAGLPQLQAVIQRTAKLAANGDEAHWR